MALFDHIFSLVPECAGLLPQAAHCERAAVVSTINLCDDISGGGRGGGYTRCNLNEHQNYQFVHNACCDSNTMSQGLRDCSFSKTAAVAASTKRIVPGRQADRRRHASTPPY